MATRVRVNQLAFTSGEVSNLMAARADTSFYLSGVEEGLNNIPRLEGPVDRRWGLRHYDILAGTARLTEFEFSEDQNYLLVFGDQRLDVYYGSDLTLAQSQTGMAWTEAMLPRLSVAFSGDTIIVCHPDLKTKQIKRTAVATFAVSDFTFESNSGNTARYQPYYKFAAAAVTLTPGATSGTGVSLVASAPHFVAGHVGTIFRLAKKEVLITGVTNSTNATITVRDTLTGTSATTDWDEQVASDVRGYFATVCFRDARTIFGGHKTLPSYMFLSKVNAPFNFDIGTTQDNEAIWQDIGDNLVAEIRSVVSFRHLQIFTSSGAYYVPKSDQQAITPKTFKATRQVPNKAGFVLPRPFDGATLFVESNGATVCDYIFNDVEQAYDAPSVSYIASHLIKNPVDMAVLNGTAGRPEKYAFLVNEDGTGSLYTSLRAQKVRGWWPFETDGEFISCAVVNDRIVVVVRRELDGTQYSLEAFDPDLALDCALTATDSPAKSLWDGFDHLAGKTVNVLSGNYSLGQYEVNGDGEIELDYEVESVEVGLYFERLLKPLPPDPQLPDGQARGRTMRLVRTIVTVDNALGFECNGRPAPVRFAGQDFNQAPTPRTGEIPFRNLGFGERVAPELSWPEPVRCAVLALAMDLKINR